MKRKKLTPPEMKKAFDASFEADMTRKIADAEATKAAEARPYSKLGMKDRLHLLRQRITRLQDEADAVIDAIDNMTDKL